MSWLKFFGLSFFSNKISKEAGERGTMNCVLGFVFALIVFICGYFTPSGILGIVPLITLAAVLCIRVAVLIVCEYLTLKKQPAHKETETN